MRIVMNKFSGEILRAVSNSEVPQKIKQDQVEMEVHDKLIVDAILSGTCTQYNLEIEEFIITPRPKSPGEIQQEKIESLEQSIAELTMAMTMMMGGI